MSKALLFIICMLPFVLYHPNSGHGLDADVYHEISYSLVTQGHLNILPLHLAKDITWQVTPTGHAPIHQNIGGVIFFLPATVLSLASIKVASFVPDLPARLHDITYHEDLWIGCIAYLLSLFSCFLTYRVLAMYFSRFAATSSLILCSFGGPLLIYLTGFPYQMHLPAAFLSALLLYTYHYCDTAKKTSWILLGAIFGLGLFVRAEFVAWGLLIAYGLFTAPPLGQRAWLSCLERVALSACGVIVFIVPGIMIRDIIFGTQGSTYGIQFDREIFFQSYLMLFGTRNALFTFWPILLVAILGYVVKFRQNLRINHVLFSVLIVEFLICGSTIFWSGELGASFGQRRFLVVLPCFLFFLARLFEVCRYYFFWLLSVCVACVLWSLGMYSLYGTEWKFPGNRTGFLMPYDYSAVFSALSSYPALIFRRILSTVFLPKHADMLWLAPLVAIAGVAAYLAFKPLHQKKFFFLLILLLISGLTMIAFLGGAGKRGESAFRSIAAANPEATFVTRNFEVNNEIMGSMVDCVAFFLELKKSDIAKYFRNKTLNFLAKEAPDQIQNFTQMTDALAMRQSLGWYRLVPEQDHMALLDWYSSAIAARRSGQAPPDTMSMYLY